MPANNLNMQNQAKKRIKNLKPTPDWLSLYDKWLIETRARTKNWEQKIGWKLVRGGSPAKGSLEKQQHLKLPVVELTLKTFESKDGWINLILNSSSSTRPLNFNEEPGLAYGVNGLKTNPNGSFGYPKPAHKSLAKSMRKIWPKGSWNDFSEMISLRSPLGLLNE